MFTRYVEISTTSRSPAPTLPKMSRMFSSTARVCSRISSRVVPNSSTSAPAMVLSPRRALVPDTKRKSPARLRCGYLPRGAAFPSTTLLSVLLMNFPVEPLLCPVRTRPSEPDTNIIQLRIEIQGMHSPLTANARKPCAAKRSSQIAQKPTVHPRDAHIHLLRHPMATLQVRGPD